MVVLVARLPTKGTFAIWAIEIKGRVYPAKLLHLARAYPGFLSMKPLLPPLDGILVHCRVTLSALHSPVRVIHWSKEKHCKITLCSLVYNTMLLAPSQTQTTRSGLHCAIIIRLHCL